MFRNVSLLTLVCALAVAAPLRAANWSFQGLGFLPGGDLESRAHAVSSDGSVVVGYGFSNSQYEAFRWTSESGMIGLGIAGYAHGVSADGSVVVGTVLSEDEPYSQAFRWTSDGGTVPLPGADDAIGVSANGAVVVGRTYEAVRWNSIEGMVGLGVLSGGSPRSLATGASADGSVVVGYSGTNDFSWNLATKNEAFRWTDSGGMVGLGFLPGGNFQSGARAVSSDGSVVVGAAMSGSRVEAFRWTIEGGMVGLGPRSIANGVSGDGSVVVGIHDETAFYWTQSSGMLNLKDLLGNHGVKNLTGWKLDWATAVSADGSTIVGFGTNPDGYPEAWIATVPEPPSVALAGIGILALLAHGMGYPHRTRQTIRS